MVCMEELFSAANYLFVSEFLWLKNASFGLQIMFFCLQILMPLDAPLVNFLGTNRCKLGLDTCINFVPQTKLTILPAYENCRESGCKKVVLYGEIRKL